MEIPLRDAPYLLLDEETWRDFAVLFPTQEIAVDRLGRPPSFTGYFTSDDAPLPQRDEPGWDKIETSYQLGNALIREFRKKLTTSEFLATGCPMPNGNRTDIKPELWDRLWPNFFNDCALGNLFSFSNVELRRNPRQPALQSERLSRLTNWLVLRKAEGQTLRKILINDAEQYFGPEFNSRAFAEAYKNVFKKVRGRPKKK